MELLQDKNREYRRLRPNINEKLKLAQAGLQWTLSSNVSAVGKSGDALIIRFHNGSLYKYPNQAKLFDPMLASNSKGHFVWVKLRRTNVAYEKIGALPLDDDLEISDDDIMSLVKDEGVAVEKRLRALGIFIPTYEQALGVTLATNNLNGLGVIDLFKVN